MAKASELSARIVADEKRAGCSLLVANRLYLSR
jgi:hypothetical protein